MTLAADHLPNTAAATGDSHSLQLAVDGIHCAACVQRIERALRAEPDVTAARVNFTTRRLALSWRGPAARAGDFIERLDEMGFTARPFDAGALSAADTAQDRKLMRAMGVSGFAAGNVMWLAISVWAGVFEDMGPATRGLLHWVQALIALPAIAYAGMTFYASAWKALRSGHVNMDVPISIGVILAAVMSVVQTVIGADEAYFDAAISLVFLLLVGRFLDQRARGRARAAAAHLLSLHVAEVSRLTPDNRVEVVPLERVAAGDSLLVAAGGRIPVDGVVLAGRSALDTSSLTGESVPAAVGIGDEVFAGTLNLDAALTVGARAVGPDTVLAEIVRCMEAAEQGRARYVVLADRLARLYAPVVHTLAAVTFLGWWLWPVGAPWTVALLNAVAVLIITCPCALAIAVPAVQVAASGRLFRRGILMKSATALERLATIDTIVFDKTGTLTEGRPELIGERAVPPALLTLASGIAAGSRHPLAQALRRAAPEAPVVGNVREVPGDGLEVAVEGRLLRLGRRDFAAPGRAEVDDGCAEIWLAGEGVEPVRFAFRDRPRPDAAAVIRDLRRDHRVLLLSGDRAPAVADLAGRLGIEDWQAACRPADKVARIEALKAAGAKVLMVGDGINDAPSLAAADASMAPSAAADIARTAADVVFQGAGLAAVPATLAVAKRSQVLVRENLGLSLLYNITLVPLAVLGLVTPLLAAVAMSVSSLTVILNALRLGKAGKEIVP
ncbi:heavy metal translocating P-type ATPase [Zavarzinia compransoris]|uniref:Cadmium-translocating P-type ATPase n=1 Tax=Zavarzinia compransoris TaxID=1264899 RepID=A0A317E2K7_9PROT|nr:heavy metal translocating P-type ATPase [Zavarzinia compransoris]PWR20822.1 cadmium-translocating P-type ATPase [Zavarzinia compransoris]TDP44342.1 Cu2+-exporting ATPase [Zavarzinia compransoris]